MNYLRLVSFLGIVLLSAGAHAQRQPVPIVNHENLAVAVSSSKPPTAEAVQKVIVGAAQARKWTVTRVPEGSKIHAKLFVRNKHTVVVEIENTESAFSVRYVSSIDMKYGVVDGVPVIHPFYNRWVNELIESIRTELARL